MKKLSLLLLLPILLLVSCSNYIGTFYNVYIVGANDFGYTVRVNDNDYLVYNNNVENKSWRDAPSIEGVDYVSNLLKLYTNNKNNKLCFYRDDL